MNLTTAKVTTISASQFNGIPQGKDYFPEGSYLQNQVTRRDLAVQRRDEPRGLRRRCWR